PRTNKGHAVHGLDHRSRWEKYRDGFKQDPALPPIRTGQDLIEHFYEVGQGDKPVSWQELSAWCEMTGTELSAWEAVALSKMSRAYHAQLIQARDAQCPPPWLVPMAKLDRKAISEGI